MARHEREDERSWEGRSGGRPYGSEDERYGRMREDRWRTGGRSEEAREVMEGGDEGWPGGVRGSEGGAGFGRGFFGTAYGLYTGRPEHERAWERGSVGYGPARAGTSAGRPPKGYARSDERILDEIVERLVRSGIDAGEVEIKVERGEVTLSGVVADRRDKRWIEDVCEDVHGVKDVHNGIRVDRERGGGLSPGVH